jgi:twitching motility protein PilT
MKEDYLTDILELAEKEKASDIHFKVGIPPYLRSQGNLVPIDLKVFNEENVNDIANAILSEDKKVQFKTFGDIDSSFRSKQLRYRVHVSRDENGPSIDLRVIPNKIIRVEDIGFPYGALVWGEIVNKLQNGLVLVTGPTNSGKTTTMASLIQRINETRAEHIITIEDPIEYAFKPVKSIISQREIGYHLSSFENGLEAAMRQDPNIILVGEIKNSETAHIALRAAQTGHLVFSTRHSGSTVEAITQFASLFEPKEEPYVRNALASSLKYVLSQKLIPYNENTGTRKLIMEVMNVGTSTAIKSNIREGKDHLILSSLQTGQKYGMITMDQRIKQLYESNQIEFNDAVMYMNNPEEIKKPFN